MNKKILTAVGIVVVVLVAVFFLRSTPEVGQSEEAEPAQESDLPTNEEPEKMDADTETSKEDPILETPEEASGISLEELQTHNSETDCWVVFESKVYDITDYIPRHPGGEDKIIPNCGSDTEFESAFTKKHGTSKVSLLMKVGTFIGDFDVVGELS